MLTTKSCFVCHFSMENGPKYYSTHEPQLPLLWRQSPSLAWIRVMANFEDFFFFFAEINAPWKTWLTSHPKMLYAHRIAPSNLIIKPKAFQHSCSSFQLTIQPGEFQIHRSAPTVGHVNTVMGKMDGTLACGTSLPKTTSIFTLIVISSLSTFITTTIPHSFL